MPQLRLPFLLVCRGPSLFVPQIVVDSTTALAEEITARFDLLAE
jgi:hypothetical protein